jgi:hypothetical protein
LLERLQLPATFVLLAPEGQPDDRRLLLDWHGAWELIRRGFAIGSHWMYRAILARVSAQAVQRNLLRC